MGYAFSAVIFSSALAVLALLYFWTKLSRVSLFWTAFILPRPLGAVVGDFLDKPVSEGGLAWSRYTATAVLLLLIVVLLFVSKQKSALRGH